MNRFQKKAVPHLRLDNSIRYVASRQVEAAEDGKFRSTGDDPQLIFWLPFSGSRLSFTIHILSETVSSSIVIYYGHSFRMRFDDRQKMILNNQDHSVHEFTCAFEPPVRWIRIDPIDAIGPFEVQSLHISVPKSSVSTDHRLAAPLASSKWHPQTGLSQIRKHIQSGEWQKDSLFLLVTHEISGTGAPLLCRKISSQLRKMGKRCVILSLSAPGPQNDLDRIAFEYDSDALFLCQTNKQCRDLASRLSQLGFKSVLLNTVVSGKVISIFKQHGFHTVSLIHEMKSSCKILHAEELVRQIGYQADAIVFPARCVMADFESFGFPVKGRCVIRPQGYYKNIPATGGKDLRQPLIDQWQLPANTQFVCGAGSINFGKAVDILALIARQLVKLENGRVHYRFLWIGGTNAAEYDIWVKDQIDRMGLKERFHFLGYVSDEQQYMDYLGASSVYALVSREDSLPSVMIESMVSRVPVTAFRGSGGAEEILADGRGFLVDYLDIESFSNTIDRICTGEVPTDEMTNKAIGFVQHSLSFGQYVSDLMEVFDEII